MSDEGTLGFVILLGLWWWVPGIFFTAWLAGEKGRSSGTWAILAFLFSPLALIALIGAPRKEQ